MAVGWQVYEITKRPLDLGLTGLVQFLPGVFLFLLAGHAADRFDRRKLLSFCYAGYALSSALLLLVTLRFESLHRAETVTPIFAILFARWGGPQLQHAGQPRSVAAIGSGRTIPGGGCVEFRNLSMRHDFRARAWRTSLCLFPRPGARLWCGPACWRGIGAGHIQNSHRKPAASARALRTANRVCRLPVHLDS